MRIFQRHNWQVTTAEAREIQLKLAGEISRVNKADDPRLVAGVDVSVNLSDKTGRSAVVVLSYPELEVVEIRTVEAEIVFPYVPGLLSFREMPLIIPAFEKLKNTPDLVIMDGQGIAHPRRMGIASHLGLFLGIPTIGCAKSRLCGECREPARQQGSRTYIIDGGEPIGVVLRTREGVKPVYVSTGHMIDLESAVYRVMSCCRGYRLPEPTRLAHQAAGGQLIEKQDTIAK